MKIVVLALFFCSLVFGQQTITGKVVDLADEPLFGVTITEQGTSNQVQSDYNGDFTIRIETSGATIVISSTPFETIYFKTFPNKNNYGKFILIQQLDCYLPMRSHFVLTKYIGISNNPYGFDLAIWDNLNQLKNTTRINAELQYQTDLNSNYFFRASAQLYQIDLGPNYSLNLKGSFEKIEFQNSFMPSIYGLESTINHNNFGAIAGGKIMRLNGTSFLAPTLGLIYGDYLWTGFSAAASVSFFKGDTQFNGRITKDFNRISTFINYYKLQDFDELSIGLGYRIYY